MFKHNPHFLQAAGLTGRMTEVVRGLSSGLAPKELAYQMGLGHGYILNVRRSAMSRMHGFAIKNPHWLPWFHEYKGQMK